MKKNVSLVLSGGGARGIAHIGVIEELEKQGFTIMFISLGQDCSKNPILVSLII